ncbi:AAA family ATPase [Halomicrobium urmianum]|uniref:AAA family ATPase n=1 Tax=Halomicrobium urmianum TaxID=1586233 RepID=UPI001CDA142B|nr:MoxR family ATPase [Halomicrobium urmianum]
MTADDVAEHADSVLGEIERAVVTDEHFLQTILSGVLAEGHVLLEDVPGTGKTLVARSFAEALGLTFNRVQFTPDLLPADITGTEVYDEQTAAFEFVEGPVFANVVLADEINRAPPKTQAALLEAMEERQVTVSGETYDLPEPFFVIATQNPVEQEGTFPLPEAQVDRFMLKSSMGYPDHEGERELIDRRLDRRTKDPSVDAVVSPDDVRAMQAEPEDVRVEEPVREYVVSLTRATRADRHVDVGVSPRGTQRFLEVCRAWALLQGRDYVAPEDVKAVAPAALAHRLVLTTEAEMQEASKRAIVEAVLDEVEVPAIAQ